MDLSEEVFDTLPLKGENITTVEDPIVYYFDGEKLLPYNSPECYFSFGNPPFNEHYSRGGIRYVTSRIIQSIPKGEMMCSDKSSKLLNKKKIIIPREVKHLANKNFLLANFSEVAHLTSYLLISASSLFYWFWGKSRFYFSFLLSLSIGCVLEVIQHYFVAGRMADWRDVLLNSIGALIGVLFIYFMEKWNTTLYHRLTRLVTRIHH